MTKRTVEEIQKEIKETHKEALFRRVRNLKLELNRAKIRDWGLRAKEPRKVVE